MDLPRHGVSLAAAKPTSLRGPINLISNEPMMEEGSAILLTTPREQPLVSRFGPYA